MVTPVTIATIIVVQSSPSAGDVGITGDDDGGEVVATVRRESFWYIAR